MKNSKKTNRNQKGQGLVEYLIIVAIIGVASLAVMRVVGSNLQIQFANIGNTLSGNQVSTVRGATVDANLYRKKDIGSFMDGTSAGVDTSGGGNSQSTRR